jgi:hypothetical protein
MKNKYSSDVVITGSRACAPARDEGTQDPSGGMSHHDHYPLHDGMTNKDSDLAPYLIQKLRSKLANRADDID